MTATHQTSEWDGMNTQTITFNFAHVLSMVEFVIPTTVTYTSVDGNYTYKGLGVQIAALQQKEGETEYVSVIADGSSFDDLKVKDCVYRKLYVPQTPTEGSVSAATYLFKGKLTKPNGTSAFFKTEQEFTPVAGVYKKVTVNVEGVSAPEGGRDIKVGDYVYVDGSIFPGTNDDNTPRTDIPEKDCIGIVYKVDVTTNASKVAVNAMALKQSFKKIFTKPETPEEVEAALEWSQIEGYKNQLVFVESALSNADALNHRATDDIINIFNQKTDLRLYTGLQDYKKTYPLTLSYDNTDWFIPALGDLNDAFSALDDNATESIALNAQDEYTCQRIDKVIEKVNLNGKEGVNNFTSMNKWLWTISESNETNAYAYRTPDAANNGTECIGRSKTAWKFGQRNALFCPFLRFYLPISTPAVD